MTYKRRNRFEFEESKNKVEKLYSQGKSAKEISKETGISYSTCTYYLRSVIKKKQQELAEREELQKLSIEDRTFRILKRYQEVIKVCEPIMQDEKRSPKDKMDACKLVVASENNILNILKSGSLSSNTKLNSGDEQKTKKIGTGEYEIHEQ